MATIIFKELVGKLDFSSSTLVAPPRPTIILSNLTSGEAQSQPMDGITLRYVARGIERYTIADRHYRVEAGQFMIAPQSLRTEIDVRPDDRAGTLGLCIFLPADEAIEAMQTIVDRPIVIAADCSHLGLELRQSLESLSRRRRDICPSLEDLVCRVRPALDAVVDTLAKQIDAVDGKKRQTRFDSVRKVGLAQAYLHNFLDRPVPLDELAKATGVSQFQLLRTFRTCLGDTPSRYHRRLRLQFAKRMADETGNSFAAISDHFGFAGGSSFSHAYRRAFGVSPVRSRSSSAGTSG